MAARVIPFALPFPAVRRAAVGAGGALLCLACAGAPRVEVRTAEAGWSGASVASLTPSVAEPVEAQLAQVPGVVQVTSVVTPERVGWQWHVAGDPAAVAISDLAATEALLASQTLLPPDVRLEDLRRRGPVTRFVLARASLPELSRQAEGQRSELLRQPGVIDVRVLGAVREEVTVALDLGRLAAAGLTPGDVTAGLRSGAATFQSLDDIGAVGLGTADGAIVRVSELAHLAVQNRPAESAWLGETPVVVLEVEGTPPEGGAWELPSALRHEGAFRRIHPASPELAAPGPARGPSDLWIAGAVSWACPSGSCVWSAEDPQCTEIRVFGPDDAVTNAARDLQTALRATEGVTGVTDDGSLAMSPALTFSVDRQRAADLGLSAFDVSEALALFAGGVSVGTRISGASEQDVRVATRPDDAADALDRIQLRSRVGLVPLSGLVSRAERVSSEVQWRQDRRRRVSLEACGKPWTADALTALVPRLPPGVTVETED